MIDFERMSLLVLLNGHVSIDLEEQMEPKQLVIDSEKGPCLDFKMQVGVKEINKYIFCYKNSFMSFFFGDGH